MSRPCPICGRPPEPGVEPFCSRRCADIDLGRWFTGQYRVPMEGPSETGAEAGEDGAGEVDPREGSG